MTSTILKNEENDGTDFGDIIIFISNKNMEMTFQVIFKIKLRIIERVMI